MTPQVATTQSTYQSSEATAPSGPQPVRAFDGAAAAPPRRFGLVEGGKHALPSLSPRESLYRRLLGAGDVLSATAALLFILTLLDHDKPGVALMVGMPLVIVLFKIAGLYDRDQLRILHSTLDEVPALLQLTGLYTLSIAVLQPVLVSGPLAGEHIAALWLCSFLATMGGRVLARSVAGRALQLERCLVIGEPGRMDRVRRKLSDSRARAVVVAMLPLSGDGAHDLRDPADIRRMVARLHVHRIIIAPTTTDAAGVVELIRIAKAAGVQVSVLPRLLEVVGSAVEFEDVDGMGMLAVRPFGLSRSSRLLKRAFDLAATSVGLMAVSPVLTAVALAIRLESKGPVFFRQERVGRDGRHFRMFKFRSMVVNAEEQKERLREFNEVGDGMFKLSRDPRVTRVGGLLRRTSLDELPQLFNVLRGEMSLVGPRPLVTDEDALVLGLDRSRLHLTPGMTGPWQVLGSRVPMQEMVGIDYLYVAGWSLWLDVKLLLRTVRHVLRRANV